jgi:hypothetical protein
MEERKSIISMNNFMLHIIPVATHGHLASSNVKEYTGVYSSLLVSLHKINNMLGKQITVRQLIE